MQFETGAESLSVEIDLVGAGSQRLIFRNESTASKEPYLLLDPRKGSHIVDANGRSTLSYADKIAAILMSVNAALDDDRFNY